MYAVIPRPLSHPQVIESVNQEVGAIDSCCLKRHLMLNPKRTKAMVVGRSGTYASGFGDFSLVGAKLEKVKSPRILEVILDARLTFETHLREVVSKAVRSLG